MFSPPCRPRVAAVSYLNTVPLVWGFEHGPWQGAVDLRFRLPSECADDLRSRQADIGLVPVIEMARQRLDHCPGAGIACYGDVRSILLFSKVPPAAIRRLAVDRGSRSSVMLARIILSQRFGAEPEVVSAPPVLNAMLADNDAALIIGDPALHLDPTSLPWLCLDLGGQWRELTGLPMVFAVWSGAPGDTGAENSLMFLECLRFGRRQIDRIVARESALRGLPEELVHRYLTTHIRYELGSREYEGMRAYLRYAAELEPALLSHAEVPAAI